MQVVYTQIKAAAIVAQHPQTEAWRDLFFVFQVSIVLSHVLPLFSPRLRRHREAVVMQGSLLTTAAALGCVATANMRAVSELGFGCMFGRGWTTLLAWWAASGPLMHQLTLRNHLKCGDPVAFASVIWLVSHSKVPLPMLVLALACSEAAALTITLLMDWHWRNAFLRHAHQQQLRQAQEQLQREDVQLGKDEAQVKPKPETSAAAG